MRHLAGALVAGLLTIAAASDAQAAGFYLPGRGVQPLGRAGAYIANGGQNLNSLWYNPANLGGMEDLQLTVDLGLIYLDFEHTRAARTMANGELQTYDTVKNQAPPKADPQILIGGPTPVKGLTWAFGLYAPYLSGHTFPEGGAQRYVLVDNDRSLAGFLHLAAGWEVNDKFRIGAGFQNAPAHFVLVNVASGYTGLFGDAEDENLDILTQIELTDLFAPSGNFGLWFKPAEVFELGMSFQAPVVFRTKKAKLTVRLPSHPEFQFAELNGDTLSGDLKFPAIARGAMRYVHPKFDVELAATWEGWSILKEINAIPNEISVSGLPGIGTLPVGPMTIPMEWKNTFSIRLGSDIKVNENVTPRVGYLFETAAIPDERYSVFLADADKHALSLGGTFTFGSVSLDAGFAYYLMPTRTITNSQWRQINPTDDQGKVTLIVGNGEYKQTYIAGGIGANFEF